MYVLYTASHSFMVRSVDTDTNLSLEFSPNFNPLTSPLCDFSVVISTSRSASHNWMVESLEPVASMVPFPLIDMHSISCLSCFPIVRKVFLPVVLSHLIRLPSFEHEKNVLLVVGLTSTAVMHCVCPLYSTGSPNDRFFNLSP